MEKNGFVAVIESVNLRFFPFDLLPNFFFVLLILDSVFTFYRSKISIFSTIISLRYFYSSSCIRIIEGFISENYITNSKILDHFFQFHPTFHLKPQAGGIKSQKLNPKFLFFRVIFFLCSELDKSQQFKRKCQEARGSWFSIMLRVTHHTRTHT